MIKRAREKRNLLCTKLHTTTQALVGDIHDDLEAADIL